MTTAADAAWAHDPDAVTRAYPRRADRLLPFDPATMPPDAPVMLDTNVYIARAQDRLPDHIVHVIAARTVLHCGVALSELSISAGLLDPKDKRTSRYREPLRALLDAIDLLDCRSPGAAAWAEAGMLAGLLARTQLGLGQSRRTLSAVETCCQAGRRRALLNDALIFLTAREAGAVLVSANVADIDLLLRFRPDTAVLLYRPSDPERG